jgi:hypothetical protein
VTSADIDFDSVQPYVVGKLIRQNKTTKKLMKAIGIANRIIAKELTFKDASKIWMKNARVRGNSRLPKSNEVAKRGSESKHTEVSLKKDTSVSPLSPKKTQAQAKIIKKSSNQKSMDSNVQDLSRRKGSAGGCTTNKTSRKASIEQSTQILPRFAEKHRRNVFEKQNSTEKMWNEVMKEPVSVAKSMNEKTSINPALSKHAEIKSKMLKKSLRSSDQKNIDHKKDDILDVIHDTPQKKEPQRATLKPAHQGRNSLPNDQLLTDQKPPKKPEISHKTRQVSESVNNITLSILEQTPKDMTPIKSPRINKPFSPRPVNPDNQKSQKKVDATAIKQSFSSAKKLSINQQKTGKSTLRKSSVGKNGKRSVVNDGDNSSYNTEEMEGMMQHMDIQKVTSNVQLRDIIPLRDSGRSINTISESSNPASIYQGSPKKEFMLEDDRSPEQAISEPSDDCLSRLSSEQRRHIAQSDMELDRSMEQFQEAGRLIRLHGKIPKGSLSLEQIVAEFLRVYQKAEVHRLPPEILLSNNIGESLNTINQIVKSIIDYIPQEHHPILTLLDECCTMLKNMLEDYVHSELPVFQK